MYGRNWWFVRYLIVDCTSAPKKPLKNTAVKWEVPLDQRFRQLYRSRHALSPTFVDSFFDRFLQETFLASNGLILSLAITPSQLQVLSQRPLRIVTDGRLVKIWRRKSAKILFVVVSKLPFNRLCTSGFRSCPRMSKWRELVFGVDRSRGLPLDQFLGATLLGAPAA